MNLVESAISRFLRLYPFYSGYSRVLSSGPLRQLAPSPSPGDAGTVTARLRGGLRLVVRADDVDGRSVYFLGDWDPRISWICRRLLRPGDTMLDIGANYGLLAVIAGGLVGPSGRVHAFEPQPELAALLRQSCELNGMAQVKVHNVALSDRAGTMTLYIPEGHTGGASLVGSGGGPPGSARAVEIRVERADDYLRSLDLGPIRLVKLDVEGHEAEVLRGASELFATRPPDIVVFESMDRFRGVGRGPEPPFGELPTVQFFRSLGYELFAVGRSYLRVNLPAVDLSDPRHPHCADLLAVRPGALDDVARRLRLSVGPLAAAAT